MKAHELECEAIIGDHDKILFATTFHILALVGSLDLPWSYTTHVHMNITTLHVNRLNIDNLENVSKDIIKVCLSCGEIYAFFSVSSTPTLKIFLQDFSTLPTCSIFALKFSFPITVL